MKNPTLPICHCPTCGYVLDSATCVEGDHNPKPGDVSVCLKCGEVLQFNESLAVVAADLNSLITLDDQQRNLIGRAQRIIREKRYIK